MTSVTLLDCFTIPAVMALSALALRAAYTPRHLAGAALCVGGLAVLVATDGGSDTGGPNPLLGDVLVLMVGGVAAWGRHGDKTICRVGIDVGYR